MTLEMSDNLAPPVDTEPRNREFDEKLMSFFSKYEGEGKIIAGKISGADYSRMLMEIQAVFPDITTSVFIPYLTEHKKIDIVGYRTKAEMKEEKRQANVERKKEERKVMRPGVSLGHPPAPTTPPVVNYGDLAGNDDTRKNLQD